MLLKVLIITAGKTVSALYLNFILIFEMYLMLKSSPLERI